MKTTKYLLVIIILLFPFIDSTAALTVNNPTSTTVCEGSDAIFSVTTTGENTSTNFDWEFSINNGGSWASLGATNTNTLTLKSVTNSMDGYLYRCNVSIPGNEISAGATLTVLASPGAPSLYATSTLSFCNFDNKKIEDIAVIGSSINWYSSISSTSTLNVETILSTNHYYATQTNGNGCESSSRLDVNITITDPATPTAASTQAFCAINDPKVSNLSASGTTLIWYLAATGGTALNGTDALSTQTYYVSQTINGCESPSRYAVAVTISDPAAPSATASQTFCAIDNPKVSNLLPSGSEYKWYLSTTGGSALNSTDALSSQSYYVSETIIGCESTNRTAVSVIVSDPAAPTASATQTFCAINNPKVSDLSASGTNLKWYSSSTGGTALNGTDALSTQTYYVSETIGVCESRNRTAVAVVVNDPLAPSGASTQKFCIANNPQVSNLLPSGSSYNWYSVSTAGSPLAATQTLSAGTYYGTQIVNGCESDTRLTVSVIIPSLLTSSAVATNASCLGNGDGLIDLTVGGGTASYSFVWSNGATSEDISSLLPGTYSVNVTDAIGCTTSATATISASHSLPTPSLISTDADNEFCLGTTVTFIAGGGTNYKFRVNGSTVQNSSTSFYSTSALSNGQQLDVVVTDANSCSATSTVITNIVNPLPSVSIIRTETSGLTANDGAICSGDNVALTATNGFASYLWSSGESTNSINKTSGGLYTVTATSSKGCTSSTSSLVSVLVNPTAAIAVTENSGTSSNDGIICSGYSASLVATGGTSYSWLPGGQTTSGITVNTANSYSVVITDANGCKASATQTITINSLPTASISISETSGTTSNDGIICYGSSATLTATGGTSYHWSSGESSNAIIKNVSETYTVTVIDANNCSNQASKTITVNTLPTPSITFTDNSGLSNNDGTICQGNNVTLTASSASSYHWSTGETTASTLKSVAGDYGVTVTDVNGCFATVTKTVIVNALPTPIISILESSGVSSNDGIICADASAILTATGGASFSWSTGESTSSINKNASGTYTVTVTDANHCTNNASTTITVHSLPIASIAVSENFGTTPNDGAICQGDVVTLAASGGSSYRWSSGEITNTIVKKATDIYTVTVTDINNCFAVASQSVTVNPLPSPSITVSESSGITNNDGIICHGDNVTLTASSAAYYLWSTGETSSAILKSTSGIFSVTVTDLNKCFASSSQTIFVNTLPSPSISIVENSGIASNDGIICSDASVSLHATGGTSFVWSSGEIAASIIKTTSGVYSVTTTDANKCYNSASVTIAVNSLPNAGISISENYGNTANDGIICMGDAVNLTASGGTHYRWASGETTNVITKKATDIYTVTVTDNNNCFKSVSQTITVNSLPVPTITTIDISGVANNDGIVCEGDNATLTASSASSFIWSSGETSQTIVKGVSGKYGVTVTDINGCFASVSATVVATAIPSIVSTTPQSRCDAGTVALIAYASDGNVQWYNTSNTLIHTGYAYTTPNLSNTTTYSVKAINNNCLSSAVSIIATVYQSVTPTIVNLAENYNVNDQTGYPLTGNPSGGSFSGLGVFPDGTFYPSVAGLSVNGFPITYLYTTPEGCPQSTQQTVKVINAQASFSNLQTLYCQNTDSSKVTMTIVGTVKKIAYSGYHLKDGNQIDDEGNGITDSKNGTLILAPRKLSGGTHYLQGSYELSDGSQFYISQFYSVEDSNVVSINTIPDFCVNDDATTISVSNLLTGGTHIWKNYKGDTIPGNNATYTLAPSSFTPDSVNKYSLTYQYISSKSCKSNIAVAQFLINPQPKVAILNDTLYNVVQGSTKLIGNHPVSSTEVSFKGVGVNTNNEFEPSVAKVQEDIPIVYTYTHPTTGCKNTVTKKFDVRQALATINGLSDYYCNYAATATISVTEPWGSVGSLTIARGVGLNDLGSNSAIIDPTKIHFGSDTVIFKYKYHNVWFESKQAFSIDSAYTQQFSHKVDSVFCINVSQVRVDIPNTFPANSDVIWEGPKKLVGTSTYATFIPDTAGAGIKYVSLKVQSPKGCYSNVVTKQIEIKDRPYVEIKGDSVFNYNGSAVSLNGNYSTGEFFGSGIQTIKQNEQYQFSPKDAGLRNNIEITYKYTDQYGCYNSTVKKFNVIQATESIEGVTRTFCYNDDPQTLTVTNYRGVTGTLTLAHKPAAIVDNGNSAIFYPKTFVQGNDTVIYSYTYKGATFELKKAIAVDSVSTKIDIVPSDSIYSYCEYDKLIQVTAQNLYPDPTKGYGTWDTTGIKGVTLTNNIAVIDPSKASVHQNNLIKYFYTTPGGCTSQTIAKNIVVYKKPSVKFEELLDFYNVASDAIPLKASPYKGGVRKFEGSGIADGKFYPSIAGVRTDIALTFQFTDSITTCINSVTDTVDVIDAKATINSLSVYCIDGGQAYISASATNGLTTPKDSIYGPGVTFIGNSKAILDPAKAHAGDKVIYYTYIGFDGYTRFTVNKTVRIDSVGRVDISDLQSVYCSNDGRVNIGSVIPDNTGSSVFTGPSSGFSNQGQNAHFYTDSIGIIDTSIPIKFVYTSSLGCPREVTKSFIIHQAPITRFKISNACYDNSNVKPVYFYNKTYYNTADKITWTWSFGDNLSPTNTSEEAEPSHFYTSSGQKSAKLIATTDKNCTETFDTTYILDGRPTASFSWNNDCYLNNSPITFTNTTTIVSNKAQWYWYFTTGNVAEVDTNRNVTKQYSTQGDYLILLKAVTEYGCRDSVTKTLHLRPTIKLADGEYHENFESTQKFWIPDESTSSNNWVLGVPNNAACTSAASGSKVLYTQITDRTAKDQLAVVGPCFDFTDVKRPIINFQMWKGFELNRDGAVLQYSKDNGTTWSTLGAKDDGVNWYNSNRVQSYPGNSAEAWTAVSTDEFDTQWFDSRHSLEEVKGESKVRLRFVYGSNGTGLFSTGLAIDSIWIGERSRNTLIEHFGDNTETSQNAQTALDKAVAQYPLDILDIRYHLNDNLYNQYQAGPRIRNILYQLTSIPASVINGSSSSIIDYSTQTWTDANIRNLLIESLYKPEFNLALTTQVKDKTVTAKVEVSNNKSTEIAAAKRVVYIAAIETQVTDGGVTYKNVLRGFIPDASGTAFESAWKVGQSERFTTTADISNASDIANLSFIAFIQNDTTGEIYQAVSNVSGEVSTGNQILVSSKTNFVVYPNPASDYFNFELNGAPKVGFKLDVINQFGIVIESKTFPANTDYGTIGLEKLSSGIYYVRLSSGNDIISSKKLMVIK